jgi:hypothetical protein
VIWLKEIITTWGLEAAITAVVAAAFKWLRPRRFLSFLAAVKEREDMLSSSQYWEAEAARRERLLMGCLEEQVRLDQEITLLRAKLRDGGRA